MTEEEDLRRLLHDAATEIPASSAPVGDLVREGRRSKRKRHTVRAASVAAAVTLIAVGAFLARSPVGGSGNLAAASCVVPVRFNGQIYTGMGYASEPPTKKLGLADQATCDDIGKDVGVYFPEHPRQVEAWAYDGVNPDLAIGVRGATDDFVVLVAEDVPESTAQRIADRLGKPTMANQRTLSLTCPSELREVSVWEATGPVRENPQGLSSVFVDRSAGEQAVVESVSGDSATAYILRRNGTARAELALLRDDRGWRLGTWEACAYQGVRIHQPKYTPTEADIWTRQLVRIMKELGFEHPSGDHEIGGAMLGGPYEGDYVFIRMSGNSDYGLDGPELGSRVISGQDVKVVRHDIYGKLLSFSCRSMYYEVLFLVPEGNGWAQGSGHVRGSRQLTAELIAKVC